jgi:hypothetical protein
MPNAARATRWSNGTQSRHFRQNGCSEPCSFTCRRGGLQAMGWKADIRSHSEGSQIPCGRPKEVKQKTKGACLCGGITFEIDGAFEHFFLCHCSRCRKDPISLRPAARSPGFRARLWSAHSGCRAPGTARASARPAARRCRTCRWMEPCSLYLQAVWTRRLISGPKPVSRGRVGPVGMTALATFPRWRAFRDRCNWTLTAVVG